MTRWCVLTKPMPSGRPRFHRATSRDGLTVLSPQAWWQIDREAASQFLDPDGKARAFCDAAGITPRPPGVPEPRIVARFGEA
jgi:hypothetical protein